MLGNKVQRLFSASRSLLSTSVRNQSDVKTVTLIPGDGIGPEIAVAVQRFVFKFVKLKLDSHV